MADLYDYIYTTVNDVFYLKNVFQKPKWLLLY